MSKFEENEISNGSKRRKKRNQFCRGKVGVFHKPIWQVWREVAGVYKVKPENTPLIYKCQVCGKHIDTWFFWYFTDKMKYEKPEIGSTEPKKRKEVL